MPRGRPRKKPAAEAPTDDVPVKDEDEKRDVKAEDDSPHVVQEEGETPAAAVEGDQIAGEKAAEDAVAAVAAAARVVAAGEAKADSKGDGKQQGEKDVVGDDGDDEDDAKADAEQGEVEGDPTRSSRSSASKPTKEETSMPTPTSERRNRLSIRPRKQVMRYVASPARGRTSTSPVPQGRKRDESPKEGEKRRRGRPKKQSSSPPPKGEEKRVRGRPKKRSPSPPPKEEEKRGRGRPKKRSLSPPPQEEEKRGRGRPKKRSPSPSTSPPRESMPGAGTVPDPRGVVIDDGEVVYVSHKPERHPPPTKAKERELQQKLQDLEHVNKPTAKRASRQLERIRQLEEQVSEMDNPKILLSKKRGASSTPKRGRPKKVETITRVIDIDIYGAKPSEASGKLRFMNEVDSVTKKASKTPGKRKSKSQGGDDSKRVKTEVIPTEEAQKMFFFSPKRSKMCTTMTVDGIRVCKLCHKGHKNCKEPHDHNCVKSKYYDAEAAKQERQEIEDKGLDVVALAVAAVSSKKRERSTGGGGTGALVEYKYFFSPTRSDIKKTVELVNGDRVCKRCYKGPSYKGGHDPNCPRHRDFDAEAFAKEEEEFFSDPNKKPENTTLIFESKPDIPAKRSHSKLKDNDRSEPKLPRKKLVLLLANGEKICKKCYDGPESKMPHDAYCPKSIYYDPYAPEPDFFEEDDDDDDDNDDDDNEDDNAESSEIKKDHDEDRKVIGGEGKKKEDAEEGEEKGNKEGNIKKVEEAPADTSEPQLPGTEEFITQEPNSGESKAEDPEAKESTQEGTGAAKPLGGIQGGHTQEDVAKEVTPREDAVKEDAAKGDAAKEDVAKEDVQDDAAREYAAPEDESNGGDKDQAQEGIDNSEAAKASGVTTAPLKKKYDLKKVWEGKPEDEISEKVGGPGWPDGWTKIIYQHTGGVYDGKKIRRYVTPIQKYELRNITESEAFMHFLNTTCNGDEAMAKQKLLEDDGKTIISEVKPQVKQLGVLGNPDRPILYEGKPDDKLSAEVGGPEWPEGWIKLVTQRLNGVSAGALDRFYYSPIKRYKFKGRAQVERFLSHLKECGGDEAKARRAMRNDPCPEKKIFKKTLVQNEIWRGLPTEKLSEEVGGPYWPDGWIQVHTQRQVAGEEKSGKGRIERNFLTPVRGFRMRSVNEVERFIKALKQCNGDEVLAKKNMGCWYYRKKEEKQSGVSGASVGSKSQGNEDSTQQNDVKIELVATDGANAPSTYETVAAVLAVATHGVNAPYTSETAAAAEAVATDGVHTGSTTETVPAPQAIATGDLQAPFTAETVPAPHAVAMADLQVPSTAETVAAVQGNQSQAGLETDPVVAAAVVAAATNGDQGETALDGDADQLTAAAEDAAKNIIDAAMEAQQNAHQLLLLSSTADRTEEI